MAITKPIIKIDGIFSDWIASERIDFGDVAGYSLYATVQDGFLYFDLNYTGGVGPNTTIWLNTDLNASTGFQIFGSAGGAEYNVNFKSDGTAALYTGDAGQTLVLDNLQVAYSADHASVEVAIPLSSLGNPISPIGVLSDLNDSVFAPGNFSGQQYIAPNADGTRTPTHKVAIVYSDTSAKNYFRSLGDPAGTPSTAYSDLFMAAQNQARMAGVSYDVIDESQLTNVNNLIGYDALIFPAMTNVDTTQLPAIMQALTSAVYDYHIGIITSGDFLTNDQTGAALANPYANMQTLLGLTRASGGNSGDVTVTANDISNPIMAGYTAGEVIQTYSGVGYNGYQGVGGVTPDVLVNQNVAGVGTLAGVVETTVGGTTNVHFATQALLGDSNLLSDAIQNILLGTQPGVTLHTSRMTGIVAARMDMDQAQNPADVSPTKIDPVTGQIVPAGPGIYDELIPILTQWKQQYNFTGSYYVDIGDNPGGADPTTTNWQISLPYYQQIMALGGEIGSHSDTHLIAPPTPTFTAHVVGNTPAGSTQITLDQVPAFYGITVGMWLSGTGIGSNTLPSGAVVHTQVTAVSGNTITISYDDDGAGPDGNLGTIGTLSNGQTLTFSIPTENTNFLEPTGGTDLSGSGHPFTYQYEFGDSKTLLQQMLGTTIYGAAVPGAAETLATSKNILAYFPSGSGYTGYVTGGWTGIESGYPSAFGYLDPTQQNAIYIAPNVTFDFTEIQYQGKTVDQALADWTAQFSALTSHAAGTPIVVWPIHDYGAADWNTTTNSPDDPLYTTKLYSDFIALGYNAGYEFVTLEDLASRIAAQEKAHISSTTSGDTINVTITPDPTAPDLGKMALDVVNNGTQVIQSVTNWYAYNSQEIFLPYGGGSFTINLGTTQADVTHIASLPMRGDLLSVTGDGSNLSFSMVGDGNVLIDLAGTAAPLVTGATIVSQVGDQLTLGLTGLGEHDVTIRFVPAEVVSALTFSADTGLSTTDFVTNTAAQTIMGTLSAPLATGDAVKVSFDNGTTWLTATAATGATTFVLGVTLTGSNTLIARVENTAGAFSTPLSQAYVLDTVAETPANLALGVGSDSGLSITDGVTNITKPSFTGKGEAAGLVTVYDGTTVLGTAIVTATSDWSVADTVTLADGQHSITAVEEDLAGNIGPASAPLVVTIDTQVETPTNLALAPGSDSGLSITDNITKVTTPTFIGKGEAGGQITVYDGTNMLGTTIVTATGDWSFADTVVLANGTHSITAIELDLAGNLGPASAPLIITIDTAAPAAPSIPDLIVASDSGLSTTDNVTKVTTPTFTGTAEANSTVTLYAGTTVIGSAVATGGTWTITASTLVDGVYSVTAKATDAAGNTSVTSAALSVKIDTIAETPTSLALSASSDTGVSKTDSISNITAPVITGTGEAGGRITLYEGTTVLGTGIVSSTGTWSIRDTIILTDGVHSITATELDLAGNLGPASAPLLVTIDTVPPAVPTTPDLTAASDSGVSNTDNITNVTTPTFTGTGEAGSFVSIYDGTKVVGTSTVAADGTWSVITSKLENGTHTITAKASDVAGNFSATSGTLLVTIDATAPAAPSRPDLIAASDTGVSSTDNITKVTTPTFTGTAALGTTVTLYDGTTVIGTAATDLLGRWNITSSTLADGVHSVTAKATDAGGNVSSASNTLSVTIDNVAPAGPLFTGGNAKTLSGTGEAGDTVTILNGTSAVGTAVVGSAGNWSWSLIGGLTPLTFTAFQTDKASNQSPISGDPVLIGTSGNDTLTSTAEDDVLIGAGGTDRFVFNAGFGQDIIADFAATGSAHDIINFHANAVLNSFANVLAHTTSTAAGIVISDGTNMLTLNNVSKTSLTSADFTFA